MPAAIGPTTMPTIEPADSGEELDELAAAAAFGLTHIDAPGADVHPLSQLKHVVEPTTGAYVLAVHRVQLEAPAVAAYDPTEQVEHVVWPAHKALTHIDLTERRSLESAVSVTVYLEVNIAR